MLRILCMDPSDLKFQLSSCWIGTRFLYFLLSPTCLHLTWGVQAPSLQAEPFLEAGNALQGAGEKQTVPWAPLPVALSCRQPLGISLGFWNVLQEVPSLAPPLPLFPTPLGAAAPGLEERIKIAGEAHREGCREAGAGVAGDMGRHQWGCF